MPRITVNVIRKVWKGKVYMGEFVETEEQEDRDVLKKGNAIYSDKCSRSYHRKHVLERHKTNRVEKGSGLSKLNREIELVVY